MWGSIDIALAGQHRSVVGGGSWLVTSSQEPGTGTCGSRYMVLQVGGAYIGLATVYGLCVLMPAMYPCTRLTVRLYTYGEELHLWMTLGIRGLSGYGWTGHIPACNIHSQPMLPGMCTQGLARPAHHWIYPWDEGSGRGRDITSCPSYRPRACGRLYTHAHA